MITVVSLNSAIDKRLVVDRLVPGGLMRARESAEHAGGKGLNVAFAAAELGRKVTVVGFAPGDRGRLLRQTARRRGVAARWIDMPGETRTCLAIFAGRQVTEILERGPRVPPRAARRIARVVAELAKKSRVVVMSGSLPAGVNRSFYARLIRACRGTFTILDTSGEPLAAGARAAPSLIRVNRDEARRLKAWKGPLVVSMGRDGAVARVDGRRARIRVPRLDAVNPVGAGDCMAAGIAAAIDAGRPLEEALALGAACGAASVLTPVTAGVRRRDVQRILKQVRIQWR